jgi:hypothetical protein
MFKSLMLAAVIALSIPVVSYAAAAPQANSAPSAAFNNPQDGLSYSGG